MKVWNKRISKQCGFYTLWKGENINSYLRQNFEEGHMIQKINIYLKFLRRNCRGNVTTRLCDNQLHRIIIYALARAYYTA